MLVDQKFPNCYNTCIVTKKESKMSRMNDLSLEIHQMLDEGFRPTTIACLLTVPVDWVYNIADTEKESDPWLTTNSTSATIEA